MTDLYIFVVKAAGYWWALVPGFAMKVEPVISWLWPPAGRWLDRILEPDLRRRIQAAALIGGVLIASFLAFSEEHHRADRLAGRAEVHRHVLPSEAEEIKRQFSGAKSAIPLIQICAVSDPEAQTYANELEDALRAADMSTTALNRCVPMKDDDRGLFIGFRDPDHPSAPATEFLKRLFGAGFRLRKTIMREREHPLATDFDLFIAKPEIE
jgi:hypothetical protein